MNKVPPFDPMRKIFSRMNKKTGKLRLSLSYALKVIAEVNKEDLFTEVLEFQKRRMREALEKSFIDSFVGYLKDRGQPLSASTVVFVVREDLQNDIVIMSAKRYAEEMKKR